MMSLKGFPGTLHEAGIEASKGVTQKDVHLYRVYTCAANRAGPAQFTRTVPSAVLARVYTTISGSDWGRGLSHVTGHLDRNQKSFKTMASQQTWAMSVLFRTSPFVSAPFQTATKRSRRTLQ